MVAKKMERVLLIMWFVSLVFVCIIGYREIINAVPVSYTHLTLPTKLEV